MFIPFKAGAKSLKKQSGKPAPKPKAKAPAAKPVMKPFLKFTPPGMDAEDKIDGGVDEKTEKK